MPVTRRNSRGVLVPGVFVLVAAAAFAGCLLACSTLWQSLTIVSDLARAGCAIQQVYFSDGTTQDQGAGRGTLTLYCREPNGQDASVSPNVLDRIVWREAPLSVTSFDNVPADQLHAQLGPRPPGLGTNGHSDGLLLLVSWIAFVVMVVSSVQAATRVRFGWMLPFLAIGAPIALLADISLRGGNYLTLVNLTTWMFPAMIPENLVGDVQALLFLLVLILGSTSFIVIVTVRRRSTRYVIWTPPPQSGPYPPPNAPLRPPRTGEGDESAD